MAIYTFGGTKGGSGKTTLATNFAVMLSLINREILFVDADEQSSAMDFSASRNETKGQTGFTTIQLNGKAVSTEVKKLSEKYDDIVIDTGGRDTASQRAAILVTDLLLIPFIPRSFDMWASENILPIVEQAVMFNEKLRPCSFINRAEPRGDNNQVAIDVLNDLDGIEFLGCCIGNRKVFDTSVNIGLGVVEYRPKDEKATKEIIELFEKATGLEYNEKKL